MMFLLLPKETPGNVFMVELHVSFPVSAPQEADSATETEVTRTERVTGHRACCVLRLKRSVWKRALKKGPCDEEMET